MIRLQTEVAPVVLFDRLVSTGVTSLDTYFYSLVELHKRRLRYESILSAQPFPRLEQVGPRAILQYWGGPIRPHRRLANVAQMDIRHRQSRCAGDGLSL